jgi:hypothetical protein
MHFIASTINIAGAPQLHPSALPHVERASNVQPPRVRPDSARRHLPGGVEEETISSAATAAAAAVATTAARALPAATDSMPHSRARPRPRVSRRDQDVLATMERRAARVKAFLCKHKPSEAPRPQRSSNALGLSCAIPALGAARSALSISIETTARRISSLVAALDMAYALA